MNKFLLASLSVLILGACTPNEPSQPSDQMENLTWMTVQTGTGSDGTPVHAVRLIRGQDMNDKVYGANCEGTISPVEIGGAESAMRCWWAGGGADFAVFKNGTGYIVRTRWVDEESGFGPWEAAK